MHKVLKMETLEVKRTLEQKAEMEARVRRGCRPHMQRDKQRGRDKTDKHRQTGRRHVS